MAMACLSIVCMTTLYVGLRIENSKRDKRQLDATIVPNEDFSGEKHPAFRYQL